MSYEWIGRNVTLYSSLETGHDIKRPILRALWRDEDKEEGKWGAFGCIVRFKEFPSGAMGLQAVEYETVFQTEDEEEFMNTADSMSIPLASGFGWRYDD